MKPFVIVLDTWLYPVKDGSLKAERAFRLNDGTYMNKAEFDAFCKKNAENGIEIIVIR